MNTSNIPDSLLEWFSAASGIGLLGCSESSIQRVDYDGFKTSSMVLTRGDKSYAMTTSGEKFIIKTIKDENTSIRDISLVSIERSVYNDHDCEDVVKRLVLEFIRLSGVLRMRVHVSKKLFHSSGKANVAVLIEEIPG